MPDLAIFLLGAPQIMRDGARVGFDTRKAVALLAYLALTRREHSREALATLLWPEYADARNALRRTLSTLQRALGEGWLVIGRNQVAVASNTQLWVDVAQFEDQLAAAAGRAALAAAAELYRGDFMAGFTLRDSPAFDEWQFFEAERLRQLYAGVLERLAALHAEAGDSEAAVDAARRRLALDPLHEPAHQVLMQIYLAAGQRSAALRQYRECARVLEQELGVAPMDATVRLYEAIRAAPAAPAAAVLTHAPDSAPAAAATAPIGRDAERARLQAVYRAARTGAFAAIEGQPGIGKTRLAEDLLSTVRALGGPVYAARCYEGEAGLAYAPVAALLREATLTLEREDRLAGLPREQLAEAARLVPALARRVELPEASPPAGPDARLRFFEAVTGLLLAACAGRVPGVMLVDDAHWADSASLDLLAFLARRLRGRPGLLLLTWRGEDVPSSHLLRTLLAEARRAGAAEHLVLGGLSADAVEALARARSAGIPLEVARRLHRESEGVPLLVVEYLVALQDGALADGSWPLPGSVRDLLAARLRPLGEGAQRLLLAAAAIGRSFDFATLCAAAAIAEDIAVDGLEELVARGLVAEADAASLRYEFSHDKLREVALAGSSFARRRLVHRRVAEHLAALPRAAARPGIAARIAYHYDQAGNPAPAAEFHRRAGDEARVLYANGEAMVHYAAALAAEYPDAMALHEAMGDLHALAGNYQAALEQYAAADALSGQAPGIQRKLGEIAHRLGEWDAAEAHFAAARTGAEPAERAQVLAAWSLTARRRGEPERAADLAVESLAEAQAAGDARALARAHGAAGAIAAAQGHARLARDHLERGLALAEQVDDPETRIAALNSLSLDLAEDDPARAIALAEAALAVCLTRDDRHRAAALHNTLADLHHAAGEREAALVHLREAVALFAAIGHDQPAIWMLTEW